MRLISRFLLCWGCWLVLASSAAQGQDPLGTGYYRVRKHQQLGLPNRRLYVVDTPDTLRLYDTKTDRQFMIPMHAQNRITLHRKEFDIDVFTIPFKLRSARGGLPPQLNSNFNACVYLGRRIDFYHLRQQPVAPRLMQRVVRSQGLGYGAFFGLGSATINEFVTAGKVPYEYDGVVVDLGLAAIYDARVFNVGLAVGIDYLADRNRQHWLYQKRPWVGVLFGLNLN